MEARLEDHVYSFSGLPVTLLSIEVRRCSDEACGEQAIVIPRMAELHRAIAKDVARTPGRLTGAEIRALRKWLGWSGKDFATYFGVTPEQVSRWENGHKPMSGTAERLLRVLVLEREPVREYPLLTDAELADLPEGISPGHITFKAGRNGWKRAA